MKRDSASATALEVVPSVNTLVRLPVELRASEDTTSGITIVAQDAPLPLVEVTFVWGVAGAGVGISTLSVALFEGGLANTLSAIGSVTVVASEVTRIVRGTNQGCVVWTTTVASLRRHQVGEEARDLCRANDRRSRYKKGVGLDEVRDLRQAHASTKVPKVYRFPGERVIERTWGIDIGTNVQPPSLLVERVGKGVGTSE